MIEVNTTLDIKLEPFNPPVPLEDKCLEQDGSETFYRGPFPDNVGEQILVATRAHLPTHSSSQSGAYTDR